MSEPIFIPNDRARRLLLERQGLCLAPKRRLTLSGLQELIENLGFVQVDSVTTVERAHHMILFTRNETYRPKLLTRLLEKERGLFENWTHDASIIPSCFFPYWRARFEREAESLKARWRDWHGHDFEQYMEGLVAHIRENGPARARDFSETREKKANGWWEWHPAKTALEYLWRTGALAITRREGFQKVYDLTERVLPAALLTHTPSHEAFVDWACSEALNRLGTATSGEISAFWASVTPGEAKDWCAGELKQGRLLEVLVEGADGKAPRKAFCRLELPEALETLSPAPPRLRALSPFDPVIRDRKRLQRLFGFDYRIEIFVPEAERRYGYYIFPLLEGEKFVGRLEMKHDKAADRLDVIALWPEPKVKWGKARHQALEAELERHRRYLGAGGVNFQSDWLRTAK